jgi:hypothetical protein
VLLVILVIAGLRTKLNAVTSRLKRADDFMEKLADARPCDAHALIESYLIARDYSLKRRGDESLLFFSDTASPPRSKEYIDDNSLDMPADGERVASMGEDTALGSDKEFKFYRILNKPTSSFMKMTGGGDFDGRTSKVVPLITSVNTINNSVYNATNITNMNSSDFSSTNHTSQEMTQNTPHTHHDTCLCVMEEGLFLPRHTDSNSLDK